MKKILMLSLIFILLLSSCSITSDIDKEVNGVPSWITNTNEADDTINYLIKSSGRNKNDSYINACDSFIDSFTENLSLKDKNKEYKELLVNNLYVDDYEIYNKARYYEKLDYGVFGYFLFSVNREKVNSRLVERASEVEKSISEINRIILIADNYYKENKDLLAINSIIDAYIISRNNQIETSKYSPEYLLNRCVSILDKIRISIFDYDENSLTFFTEMTRKVGLFPPNIVEPKLNISYSSFNVNLKPYLVNESIEFSTKQESYNFVPKNRSIFPKGVILIEANIDDTLYKLENSGFIDAENILRKANKSYILSYNYLSSLNNKSVKVEIFENDLNQTKDSIIDSSKIVDVLKSLGAIVTVDTIHDGFAENDNVDDVVYDYRITFKNEVTEKISLMKYVVKTVGSVEVADLKNKLIVYSSDPYEIVENGDDYNDALKKAFNSFYIKGLFLIKENF